MPLSAHEMVRLAALLEERGPDRVVINKSGEATTPKHAMKEYSAMPDVVFVRDDDWMLGAPTRFVDVAHAMWADKWVAVFERSWGCCDYKEWKEDHDDNEG